MAESLSNQTTLSDLTERAEFAELLLLLEYAQGAAFLFALYDNAPVREGLTEAVSQAIAPTPVFTWTYSPEEPYPISYLNRLTEEQRRERAVVFFFELEQGDDKAWKSLDHNREYLATNPHTLIFWITPQGRVDAANKAPHFWAQRSLVLDFTIGQPGEQAALRHEWAGRALHIESREDAERQLPLFRGLLDEYNNLPDADLSVLADLNSKVAWLLNYLDRRAEVAPFLQEQRELARQLGDKESEAEALVNLAQIERARVGSAEAISLLEQARRLDASPATRASVLRSLGSLLVSEGRAGEGMPYLKQALGLFEQLGDRHGQAYAGKDMGDAQSFLGDKDGALASYEQALMLFTEVDDKLGQANTQKAIGDVLSLRKQTDAARAKHEQALALYQHIGERLGQANTLQALGDMERFLGDMDAALAHYEQARKLYQQSNARLGLANVLHAIGLVWASRDELDAALAHYREAFQLFIDLDDRLGQANTQKAAGDVQAQRGDVEGAFESYEDALQLYQQLEDKLGQANVHLGRAVLRKRLSEAAIEFEAAIRLYEDVGATHNIARSKALYGERLLIDSVLLLSDARAAWAAMNYEAGVSYVDEVLARAKKD
ncbi:MAG: tetratricopeptide repeat protein [Blastocatellia bacterium]